MVSGKGFLGIAVDRSRVPMCVSKTNFSAQSLEKVWWKRITDSLRVTLPAGQFREESC